MFARFLLLVVSIFFVFCPATTAQQRNISSNMITLGSSLSATNISYYWSSNSGEFAFGFYRKGNGFAVGIWYAEIRQKTLVWIAKRDDPPLPPDTKLLLTSDGRLILQNQQAQELPISDPSVLASSASLLDSGNLVLYNSNFSVIWQSLDYPTDTLLPGQRLLAGQKLISSLSEADHSTGKFQLLMQNDGNLVQYPADGPIVPETAYWRSGTSGAGDNVSLNLDGIKGLYLLNSSGFNIKNLYEGNFFSTDQRTRLYRLTLDADGLLRLYSRDSGDEIGDWRIEWSPTKNKCDPTGLCGPNGYCILKDDTAVCTCFTGFDKIQDEEGAMNFSCKRLRTNNCSDNVIQELSSVIWLDDSYSIENVSKDTCRDECSKDCNCEAAIYKDPQCHKHTLPLRFGRVKRPDDQGIALVKVGGGNSQTDTTSRAKKGHQIDQLALILGLSFLLVAILVLVISALLIYKC